jgi:hypothetical protein
MTTTPKGNKIVFSLILGQVPRFDFELQITELQHVERHNVGN